MDIKNLEQLQSFETMAGSIVEDHSQGIQVYAGQLFQAKTVKGGTNLIIAMRVMNGFMIYAHGDKIKKVPVETFVNAIRHGDLEPKKIRDIDPGRLDMAMIGLDAIANRRTGEESLSFYGDQAEERFLQSK
jgi:hypothetical protein